MLLKNRKITLSMLIIICLLSTFSHILCAEAKKISGQAMKKTPKIDGVIKPDEWTEADKIKLLSDAPDTKKGIAEKTDISPIFAYVGYANDGIYIAVDCKQEHTPKASGFDDTVRMFKNSDTIEIFLRPGQKTDRYLHLAINPDGTRYDAVGYDNTYDIFWQTAVSKTAKAWQAEMFIPFAGMGFAGSMEKVWNIQIAVTQKTEKGAKHYRWPAGKGSFHQLNNFGSMGPLSVDFSRFGDSIEMESPEVIIIGKNYIPLKINNISGNATTVHLSVYDANGKLYQSVKETVSGKGACEIKPCIQLDELKPLTITADLLDAGSNLLFCLPSRKLKPARDRVEILLKKPCYRNTIYSSYPIDSIVMDVVLAFDEEQLKGKTLKVEFGPAMTDKVVLSSKELPAQPVSNIIFDKIRDLKLGDYVVTATLYDKKNKAVASSDQIIRKMPPPQKGNEVVFDEHHRLLLNGKLFFPLGVIFDNPGQCMGNCSKAWNFIKPTGYGLTSPRSKWFRIYEQQIEAAYKSNRMYIPEMHYLIKKWDDPEARMACKMLVDKLKSHPALLAWYLEDELNARTPKNYLEYEKKWKRIVEDFRQWDPYHPVINVISPNCGRGWRDFNIYGPIPDVPMPDIYPIPFKRTGEKISKVATGMERMISAVGNRKPVWFVPQIAGWQHYREPSFAEMRCMFYGSIAAGARGLLAFAVEYPIWKTRDCNHDMYSTKRGTDLANRVAEEIADNMKIFNGINHPASCDVEDVYSVIKETPEGIYLLVVNMSYNTKQVKIHSDKLKDYSKAVHDGNEIVINNGELQDTLKSLNCRIYSLK